LVELLVTEFERYNMCNIWLNVHFMFVKIKENLFRVRLCEKQNFLESHDIITKEIWKNKIIKILIRISDYI